MLQTVQEEIFAHVLMPKLKRAKALVMKKVLDAKGNLLFNFFDVTI